MNLRVFDRLFRWVIGVMFLTYAIAGGPGWAYVGLYPLVTASFGFCPIYYVLKINS